MGGQPVREAVDTGGDAGERDGVDLVLVVEGEAPLVAELQIPYGAVARAHRVDYVWNDKRNNSKLINCLMLSLTKTEQNGEL